MAKKKTQKSTPDISFGVLNKPAVVEKKPAVSGAGAKNKFVPNLMPKFEKGKIVTFDRTTAAFLVAGIFWHFEAEYRIGVEETLQVIDFANAENFGFSFGYEKSKDERTYSLFVNGVHVASVYHSHDDEDALQMRIEEFESFELQTVESPDLQTLGDDGRLSLAKFNNDGSVNRYREFLGKKHLRKGNERKI